MKFYFFRLVFKLCRFCIYLFVFVCFLKKLSSFLLFGEVDYYLWRIKTMSLTVPKAWLGKLIRFEMTILRTYCLLFTLPNYLVELKIQILEAFMANPLQPREIIKKPKIILETFTTAWSGSGVDSKLRSRDSRDKKTTDADAHYYFIFIDIWCYKGFIAFLRLLFLTTGHSLNPNDQ